MNADRLLTHYERIADARMRLCNNTLGPDDCKAHSPWHRRKTQTLSC